MSKIKVHWIDEIASIFVPEQRLHESDKNAGAIKVCRCFTRGPSHLIGLPFTPDKCSRRFHSQKKQFLFLDILLSTLHVWRRANDWTFFSLTHSLESFVSLASSSIHSRCYCCAFKFKHSSLKINEASRTRAIIVLSAMLGESFQLMVCIIDGSKSCRQWCMQFLCSGQVSEQTAEEQSEWAMSETVNLPVVITVDAISPTILIHLQDWWYSTSVCIFQRNSVSVH